MTFERDSMQLLGTRLGFVKLDREGGRPLEISVQKIDENGFIANQENGYFKFVAWCLFQGKITTGGNPNELDERKKGKLAQRRPRQGILLFICMPVNPGNSSLIFAPPLFLPATASNSFIRNSDSQVLLDRLKEEGDMSMVSDASSGPQHIPEQEDECFKFNNNGGVYKNGKMKKVSKDSKFNKKIHELPSFLNDTASSPFFNFSNNNLTMPGKNASMVDEIIDYSHGYSTTYLKGESAFQDHFGYFSGTQMQQNQYSSIFVADPKNRSLLQSNLVSNRGFSSGICATKIEVKATIIAC